MTKHCGLDQGTALGVHSPQSDTPCAFTSALGIPRPDSSVVERGPEKAGVGGSIPSLATTPKNTLVVREQSPISADAVIPYAVHFSWRK